VVQTTPVYVHRQQLEEDVLVINIDEEAVKSLEEALTSYLMFTV
jgi:hypothetical protein